MEPDASVLIVGQEKGDRAADVDLQAEPRRRRWDWLGRRAPKLNSRLQAWLHDHG